MEMATEKRLIDADALKKAIMAEPWKNEPNMVRLTVDYINIIIDEQPTVDAVPVVHGWWEPRTDAIGFVRCSVCHDCNIYNDWPDGKKWNYCPHCGAHMDLEVKDA